MKGAALRDIVERTDTPAGRRFDLAIQLLIVFSLVTFSLSTLPDLSEEQLTWLNRIELVIIAIFTAEYLLRVAVAEQKLKFVFSFFGIVDLLAILPFYITTGVDMRSLRACRLIRLFLLFKLIRYSRAFQRFHLAARLAWEELVLFTASTLIVLFIAAAGIYHFEHAEQPEEFSSIFDSLWWAIVTLTTVGYGDVYPVTAGGRMFTFFVLMVGLAIIAMPTGLIASALSEARRIEKEEAADQASSDH